MDYEKQKELDLNFGLKNEIIIKPILEKVFNMYLFKTAHNFSEFDFYDSNHKYLFELKSSKYSYSKYNTVVITTNKGLCKNSVFIFSFTCGYLCYIQYNKKLFNTFIKALIFLPYRGLLVENYRIPKQHLIQININNIYKLKFYKSEYEINKKYINNDKDNYIAMFKIHIKKYYKSQHKYNINLLISRKPLTHINIFLTYITKQIKNNKLIIKYLEPIKYEIPI